MKFLNGSKKIFGIFNIVDVCIILFIAAAIAGVCTFFSTNIVTDTSVSTGSNSYRVTIEVQKAEKYLYDAIVEGETVMDKIQNKQIGTIESARIEEMTEKNFSTEDGTLVETVVPELYNIQIDMLIETADDVYIGKLMSIKTKHFSSAGNVIDFEKI